MKKLYIQIGAIIAIPILFLLTNPNEKEDLHRYVGNSRGRWIAHKVDNRYLFSVHQLTTGSLIGLKVSEATYFAVAGMFFRVGHSEHSLFGA